MKYIKTIFTKRIFRIKQKKAALFRTTLLKSASEYRTRLYNSHQEELSIKIETQHQQAIAEASLDGLPEAIGQQHTPHQIRCER